MPKNQTKNHTEKYTDALQALRTLENAGFLARLAGGCVRDRLMKVAPKDFDIASNALPDQVSEIFRKLKWHVIPTGKEHGTMTVVMPAGPIEITTLRRDVKTDGRHAEVEFGASFEEDAARRDFTINAMFEDKDGQIFDYFSGRKALAEGRLRFVGSAEQRIREDYLRILRMYRFWSRLGFQPDAEALAAVEAQKAGLRGVSQERITHELQGILLGSSAQAAIDGMVSHDILRELLPGADWSPTTQKALAATPQEFMARLACLYFKHFSGAENDLRALGIRLRLSTQQLDHFLFLVSGYHQLTRVGESRAEKMHFLDACDTAVQQKDGFRNSVAAAWRAWASKSELQVLEQLEDCEKNFHALRVAPMPLNGHKIMQVLNVPPGPGLGILMEALKLSYRNGEWHSEAEGIAQAKRHWAEQTS